MDGKVVFRSGKYTGKTVEWVEENAPSYLEWVKENRPEMLKVPKQAKIVKTDKSEPVMVTATNTLQPNMNFWNEGPDLQSVLYKKKIEEQNKTNDEWNF